MQLDSTVYPNTIRTVAGSVILFKNDVVLLCDTLLAPVTINLLEIPANYWSTQYKLYVVDKSNNASVNNITINAPLGFKINGASSVTININGGNYLIRISSNTDYIGLYSGSGGVSGHIIQDEGVSLPQEPKLNFIGSGVVASDDALNSRTNVFITGGIISLTNAQMLTLISTSAVLPGQFYLITDAIPATAGGVLVQGIEINNLTTVKGSGLFFNADYQGVGNYSGVPGFNINFGIWYIPVFSFPVVAPGDVCIWNNFHYVNLTGTWYDGANPPSADLVNWQLLPKTITNGYILANDFVKYNVINNQIIYRADDRNNEVDWYEDGKGHNSLALFQWGRNEVTYNKVLSQSLMLTVNSFCTFTGNVLSSLSLLKDGTQPVIGGVGLYLANTLLDDSKIICGGYNAGIISSNMLNSNSRIEFNTLISTFSISANCVQSGSVIEFLETLGCNVGFNTISSESSLIGTGIIQGSNHLTNNSISCKGILSISSSSVAGGVVACEVSATIVNLKGIFTLYRGYVVRPGYSNWEWELDFLDAAVYSANTITIAAGLNYVGVFVTANASGSVVQKIVNPPPQHPFILKPGSTDTYTLQSNFIALAIPTEIIANAYTNCFGGLTLTGRVNGCDEAVLQKNGNLTGIIEFNAWI
jgi:hypothetical protein